MPTTHTKRREVRGFDVDPRVVLADLRRLASDEFEGRRVGGDGNLRARDWLGSRMAALGLALDEATAFHVPPLSELAEPPRVDFDGARLNPRVDFAVDPGSRPTDGIVN